MNFLIRLISNQNYKNSGYLSLAYLSDYLFSFLTLPLIARAIGPSELGLVGFTQLYGIFIVLFIEFGSPLTAVRDVIKIKPSLLAQYIGKMLTFRLILIFLAFFISIAVLFSVPIFHNSYKYLLLATIGSSFQGLTPSWYFEGKGNMKLIAFTKIFFRTVFFILILIFIN